VEASRVDVLDIYCEAHDATQDSSVYLEAISV